MIVIVEFTARDNHHAPFNASFAKVVCAAFPEQEIELHADATHLPHVREMLGKEPGNLRLVPLALSDRWPEQPELVCIGRLWRDVRLIERLTRQRGQEPLALVVSSASATAIVAARIVQAIFWRRRLWVQLPLHGQLGGINGWRTRNPLLRAIDLRSAIARCHGPRFRYLVFEHGIKEALRLIFPATARDVDVLPHPINGEESGRVMAPELGKPIRIAILGVATRAKGFDIYLQAAATLAKEHPGRLEFHAIGRLHPDLAGLDCSALTGGIGVAELSREEFRRRLAEMHYVCLPFRSSYYELSASGTLIDAIVFAKPLFAIDDGILDRIFREAGDIGCACRDTSELIDAFRDLARRPEHYVTRYPGQVEAMRRLQSARTPQALASDYRAALPGFAEMAADSQADTGQPGEERPLRIAIACSGLGHVHRGVEAWAGDLAAELHRQGAQVTLFQAGDHLNEWTKSVWCLRRTGRVARLLGPVFRYFGAWRYGLGNDYEVEQASFCLALWPKIRADFDILHVQDSTIALIFEHLHRIGWSRPRVVLADGTEVPPMILRRFSAIQHLTPAAAAGWGAIRPPGQRTYTIPNFIDTELFRPADRLAARAALGLPADALIVLSCAALRKTHKRIDYLVREFAQFLGRYDGRALLLVAGGSESETAELTRRGKQLLGDNVQFLVNYPRSLMPELYRTADLFALASLHELFGIVLLEAMASGLPVACHDSPVFRHVVGSAGLFGNLEREGTLCQMFGALAVPPRRAALAARARPHVEACFSAPVVVRQASAMYRDLCSVRSAMRPLGGIEPA